MFSNLICCTIFWAVVFRSVNSFLSEEQLKQGYKSLEKTCTSRTGVTAEELDKLMEAKFDEVSQSAKCYCSCVMGMMGAIIDEEIELTIVKSQLKRFIEPVLAAKIMNAFSACENIRPSEHCDIGFEFIKCIYNTDQEVFNLVNVKT